MNMITPIVADTKGVELITLSDHTSCKYPVHTDEHGHHTFCGVASLGSWCHAHEKVVWMEGKHPLDRAVPKRKRLR